MTLVLNGTTGVSAVDGSASTPAFQGNDPNTGMFFPAADTIAFATAGTEDMRIDSAGNVGIGTSSPTELLTINGSGKAITRFLNGGSFAGVVGIDNASYVSGTNGDLTILSGAGKSVVLAVNAGTRAAVVDSAANFQFNSGYGSVATAYGCRAWVNFNGSGTVAIRASGNVSSITDNGTGDYTVNFTTAMPDANYSLSVTPGADTTNGSVGYQNNLTAPSTTACRIATRLLSAAPAPAVDRDLVMAVFFR